MTDKKDFFNAINTGDLPKIQCYVQEGINVDQKNEDGDTPLIVACRNNQLLIAQQLIVAGASVNLPNNDSQIALHILGEIKECEDLLALLINASANLNHIDGTYCTPLMIAAMRGNTTVLIKLIESGAEIDYINKNEETALTFAIVWNQWQTFWLLLHAGAVFNSPDSKGWLPINYAILENNMNMVKYLLEKGNSPNHKDKNRNTLLHHAMYTNNKIMVKEIVSRLSPTDIKHESIEVCQYIQTLNN